MRLDEIDATEAVVIERHAAGVIDAGDTSSEEEVGE